MKLNFLTMFLALIATSNAAEKFTLFATRPNSGDRNTIISRDGVLCLNNNSNATLYILTDDNALYNPETMKFVTIQDNIVTETIEPDNSFAKYQGYLVYKKLNFYCHGNAPMLTTSGNDHVLLHMHDVNEVDDPINDPSIKYPVIIQQKLPFHKHD